MVVAGGGGGNGGVKVLKGRSVGGKSCDTNAFAS